MKILKAILYTVASTLLLLLLYVAIAFGLSFGKATFFTPPTKTTKEQERTIHILYSSMHSDIVIDLEKSELSHIWIEHLPKLLRLREKGFLAFGWGDKETYLNTPTWDDLKLSIALKALFINTPSLMHVTYITDIRRVKRLKEVKITKKQLKQLEEKILKGFGKEIIFYKTGYYPNDKFYHSPYRYNILNTCNTWTGESLYDANISVSSWTPFTYNVVGSLP
jgi:uncharacterized protein (TIGR02117 family)